MGLKDLFWKSPEGETPTKKDEVKPQVKSATPGSIQNSEFSHVTSSIASTTPGVRKQEVVDYFQKIFTENNIPGPDYQEFKNALEKMKSQPLDEATKVKTLWISFEAMGLTPQKLIDTAGQYKTLFATKLSQFDNELQHAISQQVDAKQKEVDNLTALNKKIDADMIKLNHQKLANEEAAKAISEEIQKNTSELSTKKADWHITYDDLIKEIDGHIELVKTHLIK